MKHYLYRLGFDRRLTAIVDMGCHVAGDTKDHAYDLAVPYSRDGEGLAVTVDPSPHLHNTRDGKLVIAVD